MQNDDLLINPKKASLCFYYDWAAFRKIERIESCQRHQMQFMDQVSQTFYHVHPDTRIPESLLLTPWDNEESLQKLFWLVRGGARLSPDQTWELTYVSWQNALSGGPHSQTSGSPSNINFTAIRLLDHLGICQDWPRHLLDRETARFYPQGRPSSSLHVRSGGFSDTAGAYLLSVLWRQWSWSSLPGPHNTQSLSISSRMGSHHVVT